MWLQGKLGIFVSLKENGVETFAYFFYYNYFEKASQKY